MEASGDLPRGTPERLAAELVSRARELAAMQQALALEHAHDLAAAELLATATAASGRCAVRANATPVGDPLADVPLDGVPPRGLKRRAPASGSRAASARAPLAQAAGCAAPAAALAVAAPESAGPPARPTSACPSPAAPSSPRQPVAAAVSAYVAVQHSSTHPPAAPPRTLARCSSVPRRASAVRAGSVLELLRPSCRAGAAHACALPRAIDAPGVGGGHVARGAAAARTPPVRAASLPPPESRVAPERAPAPSPAPPPMPLSACAALDELSALGALSAELRVLTAALHDRAQLAADQLLPALLRGGAAVSEAPGSPHVARAEHEASDGAVPPPEPPRLPSAHAAAAAMAVLARARALGAAPARAAAMAAAHAHDGGQPWHAAWSELRAHDECVPLLNALAIVDVAIAMAAARAAAPAAAPAVAPTAVAPTAVAPTAVALTAELLDAPLLRGTASTGHAAGAEAEPLAQLLLRLAAADAPALGAPADAETGTMASWRGVLDEARARWHPAAARWHPAAAPPAPPRLVAPAARPYLAERARAYAASAGLALCACAPHGALPSAGCSAAAASLRPGDTLHVPLSVAEARLVRWAAASTDPATALAAAAARLPGRTAADLIRFIADGGGGGGGSGGGGGGVLVASARPRTASAPPAAPTAAAAANAANAAASASATSLRAQWQRAQPAASAVREPSVAQLLVSRQLGRADTGVAGARRRSAGAPLARAGCGGRAALRCAAERAMARTWRPLSASTAPSGNVVDVAFMPSAARASGGDSDDGGGSDDEAERVEGDGAGAAAAARRAAAAARRRVRRGPRERARSSSSRGDGDGRGDGHGPLSGGSDSDDGEEDDTHRARRAAASRHRHRLAVAATREPHAAIVLDLRAGSFHSLGGHGGTVSALAWSCCGTWLATACYAHTLSVWRGRAPHRLHCTLGRAPPPPPPLPGARARAPGAPQPAAPAGDAGAAPAGAGARAQQAQLAAGPAPPLPLLPPPLLPLERMARLRPALRPLHPTAEGAPPAGAVGHRGPVDCVAPHSSRGRLFASGGRDSTVWLWDVARAAALRRFSCAQPALALGWGEGRTAHLLCAAHDVAQRGVDAGSRAGAVSVWDSEAGSLCARWHGARGHVSIVRACSDGRTFFSGAADGCLRVHALPDATPALSLQTELHDVNLALENAHGGVGGTLVLACGDGTAAAILDLRVPSRTLLTLEHGVPLGGEAVNGVSGAWLPPVGGAGACTLVATAADDGCVCVWDVSLGSPLLSRLRAHSQPAGCIAAAPCGGYLASGGDDGRVVLLHRDGGGGAPTGGDGRLLVGDEATVDDDERGAGGAIAGAWRG
ncbi:hypothetical protein KFE25_013072 [Diacronema lutheri]|uniref:Uncharacterized protein n=1 Tax=Diacronema lutheri TaxID=2081491 RepID=A0A8J5X6I4_DIALT|nr:hypothetical protein KFE25_013072 [Diacronema lutheri]